MSSVRFSPDGRVVAAGGDDGTVILYSLSSGNAVVPDQKVGTGSVQDLVFTKDGTELVCAYHDGWLAIFDVPAAKLKERVELRDYRQLEAMAASRDGNRIVTGHVDGSIILWTKEFSRWSHQILYRHAAQVTAVAFTPSEDRLVSIGFDGQFFLTRPLDRPVLVRERWLSKEPFESASLMPGADHVLLSARTGSKLVNIKSGETIRAELPGVSDAGAGTPKPSTDSRPIALHPQRRAAKGPNGKVIVTTIGQDGRTIEVPGLDADSIFTAVFSQDGRTLYALRHGEIGAWNADTGAQRWEAYRLVAGLIPQISVSPDGKLLAVALGTTIDFGASWRRQKIERIVLLKAKGLLPVAENLEAMGNRTSDINSKPMFSPDGAALAMKADSGFTLWDLDTLDRVDEPIVVPPFAQTVGFVGSGRQLLIGVPAKGAMLELDLAPEAWAREACRLAGRTLTEKEWITLREPRTAVHAGLQGRKNGCRSNHRSEA